MAATVAMAAAPDSGSGDIYLTGSSGYLGGEVMMALRDTEATADMRVVVPIRNKGGNMPIGSVEFCAAAVYSCTDVRCQHRLLIVRLASCQPEQNREVI